MLILQMKIITNTKQLISIINSKNLDLSFIPTMGGLHKGHLSLITKAKKKKLKTLVSIFVNPTQFNSNSDFKSYPRNINKDIIMLKKVKPDFLFIPKKNDLFKDKRINKIKLSKFSKYLCGKYRENHFIGVVDVIDRFLKIIDPIYIFLGEKDYQQLILIKNFINKKYRTVVVPCKTIRNKKGFAYSTRNFLLNNKEKIIGSKIYQLIKKNKKFIKKKTDYYKILKNLNEKILKLGVKKIEYLELIDVDTNTKISDKTKKFKIFISYYLGAIRLIDNV